MHILNYKGIIFAYGYQGVAYLIVFFPFIYIDNPVFTTSRTVVTQRIVMVEIKLLTTVVSKSVQNII